MRKPLLLAPFMLLAGCNLAPKYVQPIAPISASYPAPGFSDPTGFPVADTIGWRDYFNDPQLRALIGLALERNRDLAQSLARIAQARARYRIQDTQRLPQVDLGGDATRTRTPLNSLGFGDAVSGGAEASAAAIKFTQFNANVGVSAFEVDLWGRMRNLAEAERLRYLGTVEGARAARLTLIANVASTWYDIRSGEERNAVAEETLKGRSEGVLIAGKRLDAGVTSTVDYDQAVLLQTQAAQDLADVRRQTEVARNLLEVLIGGPLPAALPAPLAHGEVQIHSIAAGLPSALLTNRPDVLEAEYNLRAANANIGALRAQFLPVISLTGAFGYASPVLGNLIRGDSTSWNYGGALNLPILDWGRRKAQLREGRGQMDELVANYQGTVQQAFREVADALVGRQRYSEQIDALDRAIVAQRRLVRVARLRYDQGLDIYLQVLDAERNLFSSEQQLIQLRATALQNAVTLFTSLGGGRLDRAAPFETAADATPARQDPASDAP